MNLTLDVILWQEHRRTGPIILAQGLQYDLSASGPTLPAVQQAFAQQVFKQLAFDHMLGQPAFWDTAQAAPRYWHMLRDCPARWQLTIVPPPEDSTGEESWKTEAG